MPRGNSNPTLSPDSWGALIKLVLIPRVEEQTRTPWGSCCCCNIWTPLSCTFSVPPRSHVLCPTDVDTAYVTSTKRPSWCPSISLPPASFLSSLSLSPSLSHLSPFFYLCLHFIVSCRCMHTQGYTYSHTDTIPTHFLQLFNSLCQMNMNLRDQGPGKPTAGG